MYFDYASSTPLDARVRSELLLALDGHLGNPHAQHGSGKSARAALEAARVALGVAVGAEARGIVWTSGATEANNLALKGVVGQATGERREIVTTEIEHASILDVCRTLSQYALKVKVLPVLPSGRLSLSVLEAALSRKTLLMSIGHVNNELGVVQDLPPISERVHAVGALLHVDAAQSMGRVLVDFEGDAVDVMSLSSHKAYGPKGVGALVFKPGLIPHWRPLFQGGGHEGGLRSGTVPTFLAVAMAKAFSLALARFEADQRHLRALATELERGLTACGVRFHGDRAVAVPGIMNICFEGQDPVALEHLAYRFNLSKGAACSTGFKQSHVLKAIGLTEADIARSLRLSFGRGTTLLEIAALLCAIEELYTDVYSSV